MVSSLKKEVGALRQVSRGVVRELGFLEDKVGDCGVTHSECHALLEIERHGLVSVVELATDLKLDKSTTSRLANQLIEKGWAVIKPNHTDKRLKPLSLTPHGRDRVERIHQHANPQVEAALEHLSAEERQVVIQGMSLYARALEKVREMRKLSLRPIRKSDDPNLAQVMRQVMNEFEMRGCGFASADAEVGRMSEAYRGRRSAYYVVTGGEKVVGGGGFGALAGGPSDVCELRKMYFLPEARGLGIGQRLLDLLIEKARHAGYRKCYVETLKTMSRARALYERNGFHPLEKPEGQTGHVRCDAWYSKKL